MVEAGSLNEGISGHLVSLSWSDDLSLIANNFGYPGHHDSVYTTRPAPPTIAATEQFKFLLTPILQLNTIPTEQVKRFSLLPTEPQLLPRVPEY
jgi:hypothetical protein